MATGKLKQFCPKGHDTFIGGRLQRFCKQCRYAKQKLYKAAHPRSSLESRKYNLQHFYGITLEEYNKMLQEQKGLCIGCYRHISSLKRGLCVDHSHDTGKVRGLLCHDCNLVARKHATPEILRRLADYIERS